MSRGTAASDDHELCKRESRAWRYAHDALREYHRLRADHAPQEPVMQRAWADYLRVFNDRLAVLMSSDDSDQRVVTNGPDK